MAKFQQEISPVKVRSQQNKLTPDDSTFLSICICIAFSCLKVVVCLTGPTLFPAIIYCIEGNSQLFWQVTAVSCTISLLLVMMTITILCISLKKVQDKIREIFYTLNIAQGLQVLYETLTSNFIKKGSFRLLYTLTLVFICALVSYISYTKKVWIVFYTSLVIIGFVLGILTSVLNDIFKSSELLPYHSPCKMKMALTAPSPEDEEFEFKYYRSDLKLPSSLTISDIVGSPHFKIKNVSSTLPHYASSINHQKTGNMLTKSVNQLPINFSNFFRKLQS